MRDGRTGRKKTNNKSEKRARMSRKCLPTVFVRDLPLVDKWESFTLTRKAESNRSIEGERVD